MKQNNFETKILPNADLQATLLEEIPLLGLLDEMQISDSKRKKLQTLLNGKEVINRGVMLKKGDIVTLKYPPDIETASFEYEPVDIVYEDDTCLIAYKPSFLLVHSDGNDSSTLQARVNEHLLEEGWPYAAQAVHRIDYEAQGLVLFCKHPLLQNQFDEQFANRTVKKEYLAVIDGKMAKKHIDLNNPLAKNRHEANKMIVYSKGKPSHTHVETLASKNKTSLVKCTISTGRKHQIRVHLSHNGHPIVNDALYGTKKDQEALKLLSWKLEFENPITHERIQAEAKMPKEFMPFSDKDLGKTKS
jgi:23S rRNA pseudouridine1911/1915/1917 synthase